MDSLNILSARECNSPMKDLLLQFYLNSPRDHASGTEKDDKLSDIQSLPWNEIPVKTSEFDTASNTFSEEAADLKNTTDQHSWRPVRCDDVVGLRQPPLKLPAEATDSLKESALGTSASQSLESARSSETVVKQLGEELKTWSAFPSLSSRISERLKGLGKAHPTRPTSAMHSALDASKLKLLTNNYPDNDKDDNESIMTEDFVNKFNELVPKDDSGISTNRTRMESSSTRRSRPFENGKIDHLSDLPTDSSTPRFRALKAPRSREPVFANDTDSMVTEDFESNFRNLLFKGPPIPSGDDAAVDSSDINTARSSRLRERVGNLFHVPPTRVKLGDDSHSDTETDYVNKKFNEIMDRRRHENSVTRSQSIPASPKLSNLRRSVPAASENAYSRATLPSRSGPSSRLESPSTKVEFSKPSMNDPKDDEYRAEIRLNSLRIKRELEKERRGRETSPKRTLPLESHRKVSTMTPRQTLDRKVEELDELTDVVKRARSERDALLSGLREMQDKLRKNAAEVRFTEKCVKENRMKADDVRHELMMAERNRERTSKEVSRLNEESVHKRMEIAELEEKLRQRVREIKDMEQQGINRDELEAVIAERNELLQIIRANEETEYQKYELEKLLTMAREDLASEQQKYREKHIILEEELEASMTKITEMRREKEAMRCEEGELRDKVGHLEQALSQAEQEKQRLRDDFNELGRNKAEEFERVKGRLETDMEDIRMRQSKEEQELHRELRQAKEANVRLTREVEASNIAADDFRRQVQQLTQELSTASDQRAHLLHETEKKMRGLEEQKMSEIEEVRAELMEQQSQAIADVQSQVDRDRHRVLQSMEDQYCREIEELKLQMKIKDEEVTFLKERLHRGEAEARRLADENQITVREHVRAALSQERQAWEKNEETRWRNQLNNLKENAQRSIEGLERTISKQKDTIYGQNLQISELRKNVEEEQTRVKTMTKERQNAIARVKELATEERSREVERMRERLAKETEIELQKLRTQVQGHRENLETVMHDRKNQEMREEELRSIAERLERTVVNEINEECKKMAEVLGINARHVDITEYTANASPSKSSNAVTASLANMEACGEELRSLVLELRTSLEDGRRKMGQLLKEHEGELDAIREQLVTQKKGEVVLRGQRIRVGSVVEAQRLQVQLQEREEDLRRLRKNLQKWKAETAEEIATNIQSEFNRVGQKKIKDLQASLMDREHEIQRLQRDSSKSVGRSTPDPSAARLIGHLQEQVKQLRKENLLLHKRGLARHTSSTGDLTNGLFDEPNPVRPSSRNSLRKNATNV